jgi:hypothetical protein
MASDAPQPRKPVVADVRKDVQENANKQKPNIAFVLHSA